MGFINELEKTTNRTAFTANGAISNASTLNPLLDFFSKAGALRGNEAEAVSLFQKAYVADKLGAIRCLFYLRDIRGGQGERSVFNAILKTLDEETINKVAKFVPEYGRWDEVPLTKDTLNALAAQLALDESDAREGKPISLLAKWLPSINTSSRETRAKAEKIAAAWNLKPRQYRIRVAALRKYYDNFLERLMSEKRWSEIDYSKLPSQAHRKHVEAFKRNDGARYEAYLDSVEKGEAKINASTLFAYEVYNMALSRDNKVADAMWKNLPNYTRGENALVLADVSGSMSWGNSTVTPMSVSVSLALYFAERNEGPFKDYFLSFESTSHLLRVYGSTLSERMRSIQGAPWGGSTNLQSAFDAILKAAIDSKATQDEMPTTLYIISDMQFNIAVPNNNETNFEVAERKFKENGYELPHVVFWNVNASHGSDAPATLYDQRVTLLSGSNQSTFQYAVAGKTPMQSMLDILNSERYSQITV